MSLLGNLRNKAVEAFVKNHELVKRFGDVQSISIDSDNGTADVSVLLHGEIFPIKFRGYYYFDDTDTGTDIVIRKITSEREWIDQALSYWLEGKTFRYTLPGLAGGLAKIIF
jgi:hypothetical protein